jgi:DivIVA domain-containing protein
MTDEGFYLTPLDVRRYDFGTQMRGYDKTRVDQFRDQVADELERLTRLNQDLEAKAKGFHEQLRAFRERDKALNEALVSAQQLRAEIRDQADREAQLILREARAEGDRIVDAAREDIRRLASEVEMLERTRRSYLTQLRALVERQLHDVDAAMASPPPLPTPIAGAIGSPAPDAGRDARAAQPTPAWLDTLVND